jgi:hypothetical protein
VPKLKTGWLSTLLLHRFHDRRTYPSAPYPFTVTHTIVLRREP